MQTSWWPLSDHWRVHLICNGLCGMNVRKLIGVICAMCLSPIHWSQALSRDWSSADWRCSKYIWVINNFIAYGASYIRSLKISAFLVIENVPHPWHIMATALLSGRRQSVNITTHPGDTPVSEVKILGAVGYNLEESSEFYSFSVTMLLYISKSTAKFVCHCHMYWLFQP